MTIDEINMGFLEEQQRSKPVSTLMQTMEKLDHFSKRTAEIKARGIEVMKDQQQLDQEFSEWVEKTLGIQGQVALVDILKTTLEKSLDVGRIIAP